MKKIILPLLLLPILLAGCSDKPSNDNIEKAMIKRDGVNFGESTPGVTIKLVDSKCKKDDVGSGFACDIALNALAPNGKTREITGKIHLSKSSDGWVDDGENVNGN